MSVYIFLILCICAVSADSKYKPWTGYDGYKVLMLNPQTREQLDFVHTLQDDEQLFFYNEARNIGTQIEVLIPPNKIGEIVDSLEKHGVQFQTHLEDYQRYLDSEWARQAKRHRDWTTFDFDIDDFNTLDDIMQELEVMVTRCPLGNVSYSCELYSIGDSYEGRPLTVLKISQDDADDDRKAFWIDSAIHSGEWLAPATNLKFLDRFTRADDDVVRELIDKYDWYFLPIMNPDGYEFTWTDQRNWRKNRKISETSECVGVDMNRNYDQEWMTSGSSQNPCSGNYAGTEPASEVETQAVQDEVIRLSDSLLALMSIHTAAWMWLHPFGHQVDDECFEAEDEDYLISITDPAADATQNTFNTTAWTRGNTCRTIYPASGTTMDWAKGGANIRYSTTPELRGPGSNPGPELIDLSYQELWNGLMTMIQMIEDNEDL